MGHARRDLNGRRLGGQRDLDGSRRTTKSGRPAARKEDLIAKKRARVQWFIQNPGAAGHHLLCICDECDRQRNPGWWATHERRLAEGELDEDDEVRPRRPGSY